MTFKIFVMAWTAAMLMLLAFGVWRQAKRGKLLSLRFILVSVMEVLSVDGMLLFPKHPWVGRFALALAVIVAAWNLYIEWEIEKRKRFAKEPEAGTL